LLFGLSQPGNTQYVIEIQRMPKVNINKVAGV
jgi:hypothetical protein